MKIDLTKFRQIYLQESAEHVELMENDLLALRSAPADAAILDSIFRAAHSIKGGAGSIGLTHLMRFTHVLESLLDCLRATEIAVTEEVISLLLQSVDTLRAMLAAGAGMENEGEMSGQALELIAKLEGLLATAKKQSSPAPPDPSPPAAGAKELTLYRVEFRPRPNMLGSGTNPILLLQNLEALGTVSVCEIHTDDLPSLDELDPEQCFFHWTVELASFAPEEAVREVFEFVEHVADIQISRLEAPQSAAPPAAAPPAAAPPATASPATASQAAAPQVAALPAPALKPPAPAAAAQAETGDRRAIQERRVNKARREGDQRKPGKSLATAEASSIRVATEKVDRLIDLVGELVIAQVMTSQMIDRFDPSRLAKLREAVNAMERSTRELHERVMAVRMMPVGALFQRYTRVLYDIARVTGKQIRLETAGEETEIDKSMLDLLGDPLTHLVRNAADHGIEMPEARVAAGKPEAGVIRMRAFHRAGRVVLQISDDGAGIDTARVRAKAVERGLIEADAELNDDQVRMLIFEPGFSTRDAVNDLSGRGVGLDVVKRNVQQLSGSVSLESVLGQGSTVSIELPLTLAILEGLLLRVADRTVVLPLLVVVEAVSPATHRIRRLAEQGEVIVIRGENIPVLRLHRFLELEEPAATTSDDIDKKLVVVVEAGQKKVGLAIDELLGQQQVVVKSLETHLRKVEGLMGATILGDGRVAPILDVAVLAEMNLFSLQLAAKPSRRYEPKAFAQAALAESGPAYLELT